MAVCMASFVMAWPCNGPVIGHWMVVHPGLSSAEPADRRAPFAHKRPRMCEASGCRCGLESEMENRVGKGWRTGRELAEHWQRARAGWKVSVPPQKKVGRIERPTLLLPHPVNSSNPGGASGNRVNFIAQQALLFLLRAARHHRRYCPGLCRCPQCAPCRQSGRRL